MKKLLATFITLWMVLPGMDRRWEDLISDPFVQSAHAEDDDDGDNDSDSDSDSDAGDSDDDDDDDDDRPERGSFAPSRAGSQPAGAATEGTLFAPLRRLFAPRQEPTTPRTAPRPAATLSLPQFAAAEIIVFNISPEDLQSLLDNGWDILEERLSSNGLRSYRLTPPGNTPLQAARDAIRALPSGGNADFNHYYRPDRPRTECLGQHCAAFRLVAWPDPAPGVTQATCIQDLRLGMIDTGINEDHAVFDGAALKVLRLADKDLAPSRASHGTAVAALLIGQQGTRVPGLLPNAELIAIDAFHRLGKDQRTDAFTLVDALYKLASENVTTINLSLSGPENSVLAAAVEDLVENEDIALVAAAGNNGPNAPPAFPAAFPQVLAVTAVDTNGRIYRRANRGDYIDIAAPGVNVWSAASVKGAKWKTGTSFAAPFAAATVALIRSRHPELTAVKSYAYLKTRAKDLGKAGPDATFGAGLLTASGICSQ